MLLVVLQLKFKFISGYICCCLSVLRMRSLTNEPDAAMLYRSQCSWSSEWDNTNAYSFFMYPVKNTSVDSIQTDQIKFLSNIFGCENLFLK